MGGACSTTSSSRVAPSVDMRKGRVRREEALLVASAFARIDAVHRLLELNVDIETKDAHGNTSLALAVGVYNEDRLSLSCPVEQEAKSLWLSKAWLRWHTARMLLESKAIVDAKAGSYGATPLVIASKFGDVKILELLLDWGANINALTQAKRSALWRACYFAHVDCVKMLISRGANVNAGQSPLIIACMDVHEIDRKHVDMSTFWARRCEIVIQLVRANANLHVVDADGRTPLKWALFFKQKEIEHALQAFLLR